LSTNQLCALNYRNSCGSEKQLYDFFVTRDGPSPFRPREAAVIANIRPTLILEIFNRIAFMGISPDHCQAPLFDNSKATARMMVAIAVLIRSELVELKAFAQWVESPAWTTFVPATAVSFPFQRTGAVIRFAKRYC